MTSENFPGQQTWCEIPFGETDPDESGRDLPWKTDVAVEIPGTGLLIKGQIDRLEKSFEHQDRRRHAGMPQARRFLEVDHREAVGAV